jgi:hypothetical protein
LKSTIGTNPNTEYLLLLIALVTVFTGYTVPSSLMVLSMNMVAFSGLLKQLLSDSSSPGFDSGIMAYSKHLFSLIMAILGHVESKSYYLFGFSFLLNVFFVLGHASEDDILDRTSGAHFG